jgi:hypothetical protein
VGLGEFGMTKTGSVGKAGRGMFLKSTAQLGVGPGRVERKAVG